MQSLDLLLQLFPSITQTKCHFNVNLLLLIDIFYILRVFLFQT